jgi:glyoxalase family protein
MRLVKGRSGRGAACDRAERFAGGAAGAGVHHGAFRTPDTTQYRAQAQRLNELGIRHSGEIDRLHFHSLYFRDQRILSEIATHGPGFATDESKPLG